MRFEDFVLQLDTGSQGFRARVLKSPFGEGVVGFSLPSLTGAPGSFRDLCHPAHQHTTSQTPDVLGPLETGTELFRAVFQGQVRTLLDKCRGQLEVSQNLGLRLKIKLDPSDVETGALADLPWELLCDGETEDFFVLSRQMSLVRYLDVPRPAQPIPFTPPLRILAVGASPQGLPPLDLQKESRRLEEVNRNSPGVEIELLAHASVGAVREALSGDRFNVLHFMGHGTFDAASGEGMLAFEREDGTVELVSGKAFATKLRDLRSLGVVMLNACETARARHRRGANPFRGVATALVLGGVPAVVAMQRPISDSAAICFSSAFYRHLARGASIDEALTEGRQGIHSANPEAFEWATPVLFLRMPEGNVFMVEPAGRQERVEVPPPAPAALTVAPATPAPVSTGRGPALKIAAGAGGAALVLFVLYTKILGPSGDPGQLADSETTGIEQSLTSDFKPEPEGGTDAAATPRQAADRQTVNTVTGKPDSSTPRDAAVRESSLQAQTVALPAPTPTTPPNEDVAETMAAAADLSKLSAEVVSLDRREEGGLRLTVRFRNAGERPLGAILDAETPALSDNLGGRYSILESDLPWEGAHLRLDLAAGAAAVHTFDFPVTKLGSNKFYLALQGEDGSRVKVTGSPITFEGPP